MAQGSIHHAPNRNVRPTPARRSGGPGRDTENAGAPSTLQSQLVAAQGELQSTIDTRLQEEIRVLTTRYSGDTALAERVAKARSARGFAASDPDFASTIAPLQQKVSEIEEQIRKAAQRRSTQTIGGNGGETLG